MPAKVEGSTFGRASEGPLLAGSGLLRSSGPSVGEAVHAQIDLAEGERTSRGQALEQINPQAGMRRTESLTDWGRTHATTRAAR
jgi:hypothetical protein